MNLTRTIETMITASVLLASGFVYSQTAPNQAGQESQQAGAASSQAAPSDEARAQVQDALTRISTELNLTDDQKEKIKPILQSEFSQLKAVRDDTSLSPEQKQSKAKDIHGSAKSQISSILTPEQQQKWQSIKQGAQDENPEQ
jgi:periplasmic protein CpxP/Spy